MNKLPIPEGYKPTKVDFPTADIEIALEISSKRKKRKKKTEEKDDD